MYVLSRLWLAANESISAQMFSFPIENQYQGELGMLSTLTTLEYALRLDKEVGQSPIGLGRLVTLTKKKLLKRAFDSAESDLAINRHSLNKT